MVRWGVEGRRVPVEWVRWEDMVVGWVSTVGWASN